jgi:hypothetical protein
VLRYDGAALTWTTQRLTVAHVPLIGFVSIHSFLPSARSDRPDSGCAADPPRPSTTPADPSNTLGDVGAWRVHPQARSATTSLHPVVVRILTLPPSTAPATLVSAGRTADTPTEATYNLGLAADLSRDRAVTVS